MVAYERLTEPHVTIEWLLAKRNILGVRKKDHSLISVHNQHMNDFSREKYEFSQKGLIPYFYANICSIWYAKIEITSAFFIFFLLFFIFLQLFYICIDSTTTPGSGRSRPFWLGSDHKLKSSSPKITVKCSWAENLLQAWARISTKPEEYFSIIHQCNIIIIHYKRLLLWSQELQNI